MKSHRHITPALLLTVLLAVYGRASGQTGTAIDFGNVTLGTSSPAMQVPGCCSNQSSNATIWTLNLAGSGFGRDPNSTCPLGQFTVQSGFSCSLYLVFTPQFSGQSSGKLDLNDDSSIFNPVNEWLLTGTGVAAPPPPPASLCDVNSDHVTNVLDVQLEVDIILKLVTINCTESDSSCPVGDINGDGVVNVLDLQRVIDAAIGLGCNTAH